MESNNLDFVFFFAVIPVEACTDSDNICGSTSSHEERIKKDEGNSLQ